MKVSSLTKPFTQPSGTTSLSEITKVSLALTNDVITSTSYLRIERNSTFAVCTTIVGLALDATFKAASYDLKALTVLSS